MRIHIICLGKIKERFNRECASDYEKRLSHYCRLDVTELADRPAGQNPSEAEIQMILKEEGEAVMEKIAKASFVTALAIEGKQFGSEAFAGKLKELAVNGQSEYTFIIGSSHGLSPEVKRRADLLLSISSMTFPHQLSRILLLEQLYRAFKIWNNETYHK